MSEIDFDFATRDDCLQKMVPSDLRVIISERDQLRKEKADLLEALSICVVAMETGMVGLDPHDEYVVERATKLFEKHRGEQG